MVSALKAHLRAAGGEGRGAPGRGGWRRCRRRGRLLLLVLDGLDCGQAQVVSTCSLACCRAKLQGSASCTLPRRGQGTLMSRSSLPCSLRPACSWAAKSPVSHTSSARDTEARPAPAAAGQILGMPPTRRAGAARRRARAALQGPSGAALAERGQPSPGITDQAGQQQCGGASPARCHGCQLPLPPHALLPGELWQALDLLLTVGP